MPAGYSYNCKGTEGFDSHAKFAMDVITDVIQWGRDKGLDDPKAQLNKVIEEVGEIAHEITRNNYDLDELEQPDELCDAIGDTLVTVIILSDILGIDPISALSEAYGQIKDRKGKTSNGTFVKEGEA
jgi:NTP pyrophosphatase (non-canonical NTP hydrolase)